VALLAACDEPTLVAALEFIRGYDAGASFLRYPRDNVAESPVSAEVEPFVLGQAVCVYPAKRGLENADAARCEDGRHSASDAYSRGGAHSGSGAGPDLAILAYGTTVLASLDALPVLREHGHDVAIYDARFAKPVDFELIARLLDAGTTILTVEEHLVDGGFGSAVLEAANAAQLDTRLVHRHGMPLSWVGPDSRSNQLADAGLDPAGIAVRGLQALRATAALPRSERHRSDHPVDRS